MTHLPYISPGLRRVLLFLLVFCWSVGISRAQESVHAEVMFELNFGEEPIELDTWLPYPGTQDSLQFAAVRFYLTDLKLYHKGDPVAYSPNRFYLIDLEDPSSLKIPIPLDPEIQYDQIGFLLGVDSLTNAGGVQGGALDPTQGMYWTWQSGYIHTKIEGYASHCPARKHFFQFHLGGYRQPHNTIQEVRLDLTSQKFAPQAGKGRGSKRKAAPPEKHKKANDQLKAPPENQKATNDQLKAPQVKVQLALDQFLKALDLSQVYEVMSPKPAAVTLSQQFSQAFQVQP